MFPFVMASDELLSDLVYQGEAHDTASSSGTLALPSVQAGDILVVIERRFFSTSQDQQAPVTGYTKLKGMYASGAQTAYCISYRIMDGTETVFPAYSGTDYVGSRRMCFLFRPTGAISGVAIQDEDHERTGGNPAAQVKNASASAAITIVLAMFINDGGGTVNPRTFTGATPDVEVSSSTWFYAKTVVQAPTASDVTVDMDDEGSNNQLTSFYLEIT